MRVHDPFHLIKSHIFRRTFVYFYAQCYVKWLSQYLVCNSIYIWWHLFVSPHDAILWFLFMLLYLDVQLLESNFKHFNWHLMLHSFYSVVEVDRTISYKGHIHNTNMKVATRNNLLRKLSNSKWGENASTIRTTALALCYSVAEYAAPF